MTFVNAQNGGDRSFSVKTQVGEFYPPHRIYKSIPGFDDQLSCLDLTNEPFNVYVSYLSKTAETRTIKVSLYVPKRTFTESFQTYCFFGTDAYAKNGAYYPPTLNDLDKIKEFTFEATPTEVPPAGAAYYAPYSYQAWASWSWDGMTDTAFTNGVSYPVQGNVFSLATDAHTGAILDDNPLDPGWLYHLSRYKGEYAYTYTAKEHSVVCDIYFISQLPVKKAVPFLGYDCGWSWADWSQLRKGGVDKMVLSLLHGGTSTSYNETNWNFWNDGDGDISAYQVFDNLLPDKNGVYHISWEIKDLQGNYFDIDNHPDIFYSDGSRSYLNTLGLYVEGDEQETFNLELPEYGGQFHGGGDYQSIGSLYNLESRTPPHPLNPDETVDYPEFDLENGALLHYHGNGGSVVIPNSVKSIYDLAFYRQFNIQKVTIPSGVTEIGDYAFLGCAGLTLITIPNTVTSIGDYSFATCSGLTSVNISGSVNSIGDYAFEFCNGLTSVTCYAANPPSLAVTSFWYANLSNCTLYVPKGMKTIYQTTNGWKDLKNIIEMSGTSIDKITQDIQGKTLAAWMQNGILHLSGLTVGKSWSVYDVSGKLVYQSIAKSEKVDIPLFDSRVYLIQSGGKTVKVVNK